MHIFFIVAMRDFYFLWPVITDLMNPALYVRACFTWTNAFIINWPPSVWFVNGQKVVFLGF